MAELPDQNEINKSAKEALALVRERARLEADINKSVLAYSNNLKNIITLQKSISHIEDQIKKIQEKSADLTGEEKLAQQEILKFLNKKVVDLREEKNLLVGIVKETKKQDMIVSSIGKTLSKIPGLVQEGFGKIKQMGLFDMDKSIKMAGLQMGILGKQTDGFRTNITNSALGIGQLNDSTIELGVGIEDLAKMQAEYSEDLGRTVVFSQQANMAMAELAKGTILGADGATKLATEMDNVGFGAESTRDFIQQTMNDAHKMGLNASKVVKNISANIKLLNKYNFKDGAKGLARMAESATKLGVDMNLVAPMAEKLFDIEGAVDMSAQLQVMGGEWAKLADPFKLMNMARNDMDGLFESVVNATKGAAQFNKTTGQFDISALEMSRLRKVAEATGLNFEDLAIAAKKAAKATKIEGQIRIDADKGTKEFIANTAEFNEKGEAKIMVGTDPKLLKDLRREDIALIKAQALDAESLKERAKDAQTFDDALKNTLNLFKTAMLPIVKSINDTLMPMIKNIFADKEFKAKLVGLGKTVGDFIGSVLKFGTKIFDLLGPTGSLALILGTKGLMAAAQWFQNGKHLWEGFKMGQASSGLSDAIAGDVGGGSGGSSSGKKGKGGKLGGKLGKMSGGGIGGAVVGGLGALASDSTGEGIGNVAGGIIGGALGTLLDPFLGPFGTILGAQLGSVLGGMAGKWIGEQTGDGIIESPIHDGISKKLGSDYSKGRGIVQGGKITPIDNKDDLIAAKPNGIIDGAMKANKPSTMKIEFGEIRFKFDELKVTSPGHPGVAIDLLKDPQFIRNITKMIHVETNKAIGGGKISPNAN